MTGDQIVVFLFVLFFFGGLAAIFTYIVLYELWRSLTDRGFFVAFLAEDDEEWLEK